MKKIAVVIIMACLFVAGHNAWAGTWREASQADFADGDFNANVFTSTDGSDSGCIKTAPGALYDLNKDGRADLVICNLEGSSTYIYWGKHDWTYSSDSCQYLPSNGSTGNSIDDIDRDGNLDILISNFYGSFSTIYWGSKNGFTNGDTTLLQTSGGHGNCLADLNHDGALDLLVSSMYNTEVYIFWGNKHNRRSFNRTTLGGFSSSDIAVADLNKDGILDIVVPNKQGSYPPAGGFTFSIPSYIYYGQKIQDSIFYNNNSKDSLETYGTYCVSIGDVDKDGWLDIVFSNHHNGSTYNINSYIYWGSATGFKTRPRKELETHSAIGNTIVDLDRDGDNDIIFANWYNDVSHKINSYVYWGPNFTSRTELPTNGAHGALVGKISNNSVNDVLITNSYGGWSYIFHGVSKTGYLSYDSLPSSYGHISTKDNGNVHNKGDTEIYGSSVFGDGLNIYEWGSVNWTAQAPDSTGLSVSLRSGNTTDPEDGSWSMWMDVAAKGAKTSIPNSKYVQYKLTSTANKYFESPVIEEVSIDYTLASGISGLFNNNNDRIEFNLLPNFKGANIKYNLNSSQKVKIAIYNITGRLIKLICDEVKPAGSHAIKWEGINAGQNKVSAGIYICRMSIANKTYTKTIPFIK
ncbi:MAG: hypothetical protein A2509_06865 [Candidatus Edwardsbacteria bacterium RIFOXYD12_FULL_50_11]|uniref:FlgD/Vpr Ig-like domain-containing protein n=1 Tax=Candidatus Edwardsbacteria bacterium GWF2_54_11 TaxID=1817851 RepID=A0A1F5R3E7_9BACT|nr:MAG: hypothetical protein A2502_09750 [Candidatus Edwardsbacteria bacterium RifOxyC12_full_54_24]OGF06871.1 MAG: hypothetical protein A2273_01310 [Candidatus Edwardsbacteria bacterium RifOxyA12_full_54_48]OGF08936.1 MAG: hypothetical protein A2024_01570 [Candidatus Edwardsbacteria bacterium GWF2_54_11]OGF10821.1 MAG: hypothetical protein A3K15_06680 [Candidatus Edwardsbacteria bacterium GWE2_54_12]OGF15601.1 MAG: hypothetical protein A2509_06865 [Candidatus Edwardsbacteria bacterium RIFOXYD1